MAGYGLKSFLIAQSLNQIEKAYGQNNSILDNCHVRVELRHERRAHRQARLRRAWHRDRNARHEELCGQPAQPVARPSDGLAPGDRAAAADARRGHAAPAGRRAGPDVRLRAHPGEEGPLLRRPRVAGAHPPAARAVSSAKSRHRPTKPNEHTPDGDWAGAIAAPAPSADTEDPANAGIRREPELPEHEEIVPEPRKPVQEFEPIEEEPDDEAQRQRIMQRNFGNAPPGLARSRRRHADVAMRTKHTFRLPPDLAGKLADYAARKRVPQALDRRGGARFPPVARWRRSA